MNSRAIPRYHGRFAFLFLAVLIASISYAVGTSYTSPAKGRIVGTKVGLSTGEGFDSCTAYVSNTLQAMWPSTHYAYIGVYIGGITALKESSCNTPDRKYLSNVHSQGWDFLPIFDGKQAPCGEGYDYKFSADPTDAFSQARTEAAVEADNAAGALQKRGFIVKPGTIVYYDLENFNQEGAPNCKSATEAFINNWVRVLHEQYGVTAGLYGSANASHLAQFWGIANPPDDIWIGDAVMYGSGETPEKSVYKVNSSIPSTSWPNRRLRQYETERIQTVNVSGTNVQITIDRDCAHGLVAGSGEKKEEPECSAK